MGPESDSVEANPFSSLSRRIKTKSEPSESASMQKTDSSGIFFPGSWSFFSATSRIATGMASQHFSSPIRSASALIGKDQSAHSKAPFSVCPANLFGEVFLVLRTRLFFLVGFEFIKRKFKLPRWICIECHPAQESTPSLPREMR